MDALRDWLEAREMVRTLQALILVAHLHLHELRPLVSDLTGEVESGKALTPATAYLFDSTLRLCQCRSKESACAADTQDTWAVSVTEEAAEPPASAIWTVTVNVPLA